MKFGSLTELLGILRHGQSVKARILEIDEVGDAKIGWVISDVYGSTSKSLFQAAENALVLSAVDSENSGTPNALNDKAVAKKRSRNRHTPPERDRANRTLLNCGNGCWAAPTGETSPYMTPLRKVPPHQDRKKDKTADPKEQVHASRLETTFAFRFPAESSVYEAPSMVLPDS